MNYDFIEWYKLNLDIRADLITMIEGIRPGAKIEMRKLLERRSEKYFLYQKGLLVKCLDALKIGYGYDDWSDNLYAYQDGEWVEKLCSDAIKEGEFLGYPECCINNFEQACKAFLNGVPTKGPAVEFEQKVKRARKENVFNDLIYYRLHVPCDVNCKKTLDLSKKIKDVLEKNDLEAAFYLRDFNENKAYIFGGGDL